MTNHYKLADIDRAAKRKYAPVTVDLSDGTEVVLRGIIRLSEDERKSVLDNLRLHDELDLSAGYDAVPDSDKKIVVEALNEVIEVLAPGLDGRRLVSEVDGDFLILSQLINTWMRETNAGEAVSSPNS